MEVVKIRGSYRVMDENGNYARYTEEEYNQLFGNPPVVAEEPVEDEHDEEEEELPLDAPSFLTNV